MSILILRFTVLQLGGCLIIRHTFGGVFLSPCEEPKNGLAGVSSPRFQAASHVCVFPHASSVKSPSLLNTRKPLTRRSGELSPPKFHRSELCRFQLAANG